MQTMPDPFSIMMQMLPYVFLLMMGIYVCLFLCEMIQAILNPRDEEGLDKQAFSQGAERQRGDVLDSRLNLDPDILDKLKNRQINSTKLSSFDIK